MIVVTLTPNEYAQVKRRRLGLKQAEVAQIVGVTRGLVTGFESGRVNVSDSVKERLETALEMSPGDLR